MPKKIFFLLAFCFLLSASIYSQTWTVRDSKNGKDFEYTVITKEQFGRLLRQYEASSVYCFMDYTDSLEMNASENIISGKYPSFNGYYYLMVKTIPHNSKIGREALSANEAFQFYRSSNLR